MVSDAATAWPQILFIMGKGGVGRSTVSGALALHFAARGERVLIMEWTVSEAFAPWFGLPPPDAPAKDRHWKWIPRPREIAPRVSVFNYRLQEALRGYFVDHLGLERFYEKVVDGPHIRRLIEAAPGIAELLFVGQLWWMVELAPNEAGFGFDRIIVDAPATGHGASLLDLPATLTTIGATGLLALEVQRLVKLLADPSRVGAAVVSLPEELSVEETVELVPRIEKDLGRKPLLAFINRSIPSLPLPAGAERGRPAERGRRMLGAQADNMQRPSDQQQRVGERASRLSAPTREALDTIRDELRARVRREAELRTRLEGKTTLGVFSLTEQLLNPAVRSPREVITALAAELERLNPTLQPHPRLDARGSSTPLGQNGGGA